MMMQLSVPATRLSIYSIAKFFLVIVSFAILGCGDRPVELPSSTVAYSLNNPTVQEIFDLQDRRSSKELMVFFNHPEATYRYITAMAFASIQDTSDAVIEALAEATNDQDPNVRLAAIYSLGQTYHIKATLPLVKAFKNDLATANNEHNALVLEGIGKCAPKEYLDFLIKPKKYTTKDTLLLDGQAKGVYRFALRGITTEAATKLMVEYATDMSFPVNVRRTASHYLGRAKGIDLTDYKTKIQTAISEGKDNFAKMALVLAAPKIEDTDTTVFKSLNKAYKLSNDYRLKINIMRAMSGYEYPQTRTLMLNALKDPNENVKMAAAEYFFKNGDRKDVDIYYEFGNDSTNTDWRFTTTMLGAALANVSYTRSAFRKQINEQLIALYQNAKDDYQKALTLRMLSGFANNYKMLIEEAQKADNPAIIRTTAIEGLTDIRANPRLPAIFGEYYGGVSFLIQKAFKEAILSEDAGVISAATQALRKPEFKYNVYFRYDYDFLKMAQKKLKLPKETEAYYDLQRTINFFEGKDVAPDYKIEKPGYNHLINWNELKKINQNSTATIQTAKGDIVLTMYHTFSPGALAMFLKMANSDYYKGKTFHRVVRNFVAQGGCPRGDGYGSLDFSMRSELGLLRYDDEGYVGLASAGKDTEGVQFFITHSPTPHLDGRYTIFAKVIEGMEIVHQLQVGDKIEDIIIDFNEKNVQ